MRYYPKVSSDATPFVSDPHADKAIRLAWKYDKGDGWGPDEEPPSL